MPDDPVMLGELLGILFILSFANHPNAIASTACEGIPNVSVSFILSPVNCSNLYFRNIFLLPPPQMNISSTLLQYLAIARFIDIAVSSRRVR